MQGYQSIQNSWHHVYSDQLFVEQLCRYSGINFQSDFCIKEILENNGKNSLIIFNELENAIKCRDAYMIFEVLSQYEDNLFKPLEKAILKAGLTVTILTNGNQSFFINKRKLKSWWIRRKSTGNILEYIA
jgi:predicted DNA-binding antitoxin AbrB/MazE fold protein